MEQPERVAEIEAEYEIRRARMRKSIPINPLRPVKACPDDIDDIYAVEQILNERLGNHLWGMKPIIFQTKRETGLSDYRAISKDMRNRFPQREQLPLKSSIRMLSGREPCLDQSRYFAHVGTSG